MIEDEKKHKASIETLKAYNYQLPESLIASYPHTERSKSRLLVYQMNKTTGKAMILNKQFCDLPYFLKENDLLIYNDTRVSWRRLQLQRANKKILSVLFLKELEDNRWVCLLRGKAKLKKGEVLSYADANQANTRQNNDGNDDRMQLAKKIEFIFDGSHSIIESLLVPVQRNSTKAGWLKEGDAEDYFFRYGETPIPPYLKRSSELIDRERYQTIYAKGKWSVAAPTAGLHFSLDLLDAIKKKGSNIEALNLEIGYGTFAPLKKENFSENKLHSENYYLSHKLAQLLNQNIKGRKIAVGTSTLRALETNFRKNKRTFKSGKDSTRLFLKPPENIITTDGLITNFHLPESSLLMLISSYIGSREETLRVYDYAIKEKYRFFSYGDAMLILR